jgi:hypothetical protein
MLGMPTEQANLSSFAVRQHHACPTGLGPGGRAQALKRMITAHIIRQILQLCTTQ